MEVDSSEVERSDLDADTEVTFMVDIIPMLVSISW